MNFLQKLRYFKSNNTIVSNSSGFVNISNRFCRFVLKFRQIHFVNDDFKNINEFICNIDFTILNETKNFRNFFMNSNIGNENHFSITIKKKSLLVIRNKRFKKYRRKDKDHFSITMKKKSLSIVRDKRFKKHCCRKKSSIGNFIII